MTLKMRFVDLSEVKYQKALETEKYWRGSSRRTLTFNIARIAANLEELALCTEGNLKTLELINKESEIVNIYGGYVLELKLGVEPVLIDAETQTYEENNILKLGKRTVIEQKLYELGI